MEQSAHKAFAYAFSTMATPRTARATCYFEQDGCLFRLQIDNLTKPVVVGDVGDNLSPVNRELAEAALEETSDEAI